MASSPLEESEALFRILFDKSADAIFVVDMQGLIERANQTACDRLQYSLEELVGQKVSRFHGPESRDRVDGILRTLRDIGWIRAEIVHVARDGTSIPTEIYSHVVEIQGQPRVLTTARDISERHHAEGHLRTSQARYRNLFENSGTANLLYDRDLRLVLVNDLAAHHLGRPAEGLLGRTVDEIFGPALGVVIRARGERVLGSRATESITQKLDLPGGNRWFQTSFGPVIDEGGTVSGVQVVSLDITELHDANERLRQTEKLESIGVLAGGIAHDFNNLLAGLAGHLDLARMHLQEGRPTEALARLDRSNQVFNRAKSLTRQLLTFSKGGAPMREVHMLGPLLKEWAEFALSGSEVSLVFESAPDLWLCDCDALQIAQVVDNLLINAQQTTAAGEPCPSGPKTSSATALSSPLR